MTTYDDEMYENLLRPFGHLLIKCDYLLAWFVLFLDLDDINKHMPGYLDDTRNWFRIYKVADGKPFNNFAFDGQYKGRDFAEAIVNETHGFWKELIHGRAEGDIDK